MNDEDVLAIYHAPVSETMIKDLSNKYNVSPQIIRNILIGRTYKHLTGGRREIPRQKYTKKLTNKNIQEIQQQPYTYGSGARLARKYGISRAMVSKLRKQAQMNNKNS